MKTQSLYSFILNNKYILLGSLIGLTLITLFLTLMPAAYLAQNSVFSHDKIGHLGLFGGWTYFFGLYQYYRRDTHPNIWLIFAGGVLFGGLIEIMQLVLPLNRDPDIIDWIFDIIGCLIAVWLLKITFSQLKKSNKKELEK